MRRCENFPDATIMVFFVFNNYRTFVITSFCILLWTKAEAHLLKNEENVKIKKNSLMLEDGGKNLMGDKNLEHDHSPYKIVYQDSSSGNGHKKVKIAQNKNPENFRHSPTTARAHGVMSAIIAWLIITTFGFSGLILIPLKKYKMTYSFILQFLTAMGFSSLTGDVVFHLIPHGLLSSPHAHDHDTKSSKHDHHAKTSEHDHHDHGSEYGKLAILLFGLIFLYFVEIILKIIPFTRKRECGCHGTEDNKNDEKILNLGESRDFQDETKKKCCSDDYKHSPHDHKHKHSPHSHKEKHSPDEYKHKHSPDDRRHSHHSDDHKHHDCVNIEAARDIKLTSIKHRLGAGVPPDVTAALNRNQIETCPIDEDELHDMVIDIPAPDCSTAKEAKNVVLVLLFADMCHHVLDGLAIGAIFVQDSKDSFSNGISFSLAVFFHELPHKVGDIALLVKSGYSERKATFIVVGTSSISIIGLVIGCFTASKFDSASQWIQLFTAGMFIYISLVLMMSQMLNAVSKPDLHVSIIILAHFLGMTLGFLTMFLLTKLEHSH